MNSEEARRRRAINRIAAEWSMTRQQLETRLELTSRFPVDVVEAAVLDVIATHDGYARGPAPERLVAACRVWGGRVAAWERLRLQDEEYGTCVAGPHPLVGLVS